MLLVELSRQGSRTIISIQDVEDPVRTSTIGRESELVLVVVVSQMEEVAPTKGVVTVVVGETV